MGIYTNLSNAAVELIDKFGMLCDIKTPTAGSPAIPGKDWKPTANTWTTNTVKVAFLPEETINFYTQFRSLISKEEYQVGYEYGLMANNGFEPKLDMLVVRGSFEQRIKYVSKYAPAGTALLYVIGLKE